MALGADRRMPALGVKKGTNGIRMSPGKRMLATFVGAHRRDHHGDTLLFSCPIKNTLIVLVYPPAPPPSLLCSIRLLFIIGWPNVRVRHLFSADINS